MKILTSALLSAAFAARNPRAAQPGVIPAIHAGTEGVVDSIQAQAAVRGFSQASGPLQWVKATIGFFEAGEYVAPGDYVEVKSNVATWLESQDRAVLVDVAEVEAAQLKKTTVVKG